MSDNILRCTTTLLLPALVNSASTVHSEAIHLWGDARRAK